MSTQVMPYAFPAVDQSHAFPTLSDAQVERVRSCGHVREVEAGEILFEPGDINVPFFVVLSGALEIVQRRDDADLESRGAGARQSP
jgi:thioredoxin reductase (NADPH)